MLVDMKGTCYVLAISTIALILTACGTRRSVVVEPVASHVRQGMPPAGHDMPPPEGTYRVARGDTLYSIAFRHGQDFRDVARWNGIAAPYTIWPGQQLVMHPANATGRVAAPVASRTRPSPPIPRPSAPVLASRPAPSPAPPLPTVVADAVPVAGVPAPVAAPPLPVATTAPSGATRTIGGVNWRWPADGQMVKGFQSGDAIPGIEIGGAAGSPVRAAADGVVVYSGNGLVGYGELVIVKHNDDFLSAYGHNRKRLVKEGQRVSAGQQIAEMGSTGAARDELQFQIRRNGNPVNPLDYLPSR